MPHALHSRARPHVGRPGDQRPSRPQVTALGPIRAKPASQPIDMVSRYRCSRFCAPVQNALGTFGDGHVTSAKDKEHFSSGRKLRWSQMRCVTDSLWDLCTEAAGRSTSRPRCTRPPSAPRASPRDTGSGPHSGRRTAAPGTLPSRPRRPSPPPGEEEEEEARHKPQLEETPGFVFKRPKRCRGTQRNPLKARCVRRTLAHGNASVPAAAHAASGRPSHENIPEDRKHAQ